MATAIDSVWTQTKHLNFRNMGTLRPGAKTRVFMVLTRKAGTLLGHVRWNSLKNQYDFDISSDLSGHALSNKIVSDLQSFCEWATIQFRKTHPKKIPDFKKRRASRIRNLLQKPDGGGLDKRYAPVVK
jgi:hypothetical protein